METVIKITLPYAVADLQVIERRLAQCDCIVHYDPKFPRYSVAAYHHDAALHQHKYYALFDLNVLSNVLDIARGNSASESMRNAAALMAFLMSFDGIIEPGMSAQEYSSINGEVQTRENIRLFRQADNAHPAIYASITCNRCAAVSPEDLPNVRKHSPVRFRPYIAEPYWQHYGALLKLGILLHSPGGHLDKLKSYMEWQRDEYFFGSCTTIFAIQSLGPQPIADPLKQGKKWAHRDPLDGVRNAVWDMSIVKYWADRIFDDHKNNVHWLFCSFDASLRELAKNVIVSTSLAPDLQLQRIVNAHWPKRMVGTLLSHLALADSVRDDDHMRQQRVRETKASLPVVVRALEEEFMNRRRQP